MHTKKDNHLAKRVLGRREIGRLVRPKSTNHNTLKKSLKFFYHTKVLHRITHYNEANDKVYERKAPLKQKHHQQTNGEVHYHCLGLQGILNYETEDLETLDLETEVLGNENSGPKDREIEDDET